MPPRATAVRPALFRRKLFVMETDSERYERERIADAERHERERKEAHERHERERLEEKQRREQERQASDSD